MSEIKKTIGENIRFERQQRNMSLEDLAEILGITPGFLGLVERGHRGTDISKLAQIAKVFGVTIDHLTLVRKKNEAKKVKEANDPVENKKSTVYSMVFDLDIKELEFIIQVVRSLKQLR
ncbi:MAG: helix-turn-helix domain-containing protein [Clostridiales bacterium]|jgi:transcriptional regulator with XRE-family HTH domain|nr:helix-turn-helix domain-containing protein [Clostridiales bacterium]